MSWQPIIAWTIVAVAAAWLARRIYRLFAAAKRGDVRGCGTCSKNVDAKKTVPLVQLDRKNPQ